MANCSRLDVISAVKITASPVLSRTATLLAPRVGCYDKWAINFALDLALEPRGIRCSLRCTSERDLLPV